MKKAYAAPAIEIIEYNTEDIMTASGVQNKGMLGLLSGSGEATYNVNQNDNPLWFK